jgi:hypothetical protein
MKNNGAVSYGLRDSRTESHSLWLLNAESSHSRSPQGKGIKRLPSASSTSATPNSSVARIASIAMAIARRRRPVLLKFCCSVCLRKVDTPVSFPCGRDELLDITQNSFFRDEKRVMFELTAVCAHLGSSIDSGHYVAYARRPDFQHDATSASQWLRIDDDVVSVIDEATLRRETLTSAYLLFYSQVPR